MTRAIDFARDRLGDRLKQHVEAGDPIQKILEVAATVEPELIVMGTHGRVGRLHAILGSVAEAVVRNSARPVLTVRQPDGEEESFAERVHGRQRIAAQKPAAG